MVVNAESKLACKEKIIKEHLLYKITIFSTVKDARPREDSVELGSN